MKRSRPKLRRSKKIRARVTPEQGAISMPDVWERFDAILAEIDHVPDLPESFDPLEWDKRGLPR
jgi:hypothetical protein